MSVAVNAPEKKQDGLSKAMAVVQTGMQIKGMMGKQKKQGELEAMQRRMQKMDETPVDNGGY